MQTTNNPLTEIGAIVLSMALIAGGVLLLVLKDVDTAYGISIFILAGTIFAGNLALKAPSPTQQAALLSLTAQALQTQQAPAGQLVQAPAPVATPNTAAMMEQAAQYANALSTPGTTMPQAIMTTQNMPAVKP